MTLDVENLHHPHLRTRLETAQKLIQSGKAALPILLSAFAHPEVEVRWRAAALTGWIGDAGAIPALVDLSDGAGYEIKLNCVWALGQIGHASAVPPLLNIFHADENESPDIRYAAALALLRLGQRDILRQAQTNSAASIQRVAASVLATLAFAK